MKWLNKYTKHDRAILKRAGFEPVRLPDGRMNYALKPKSVTISAQLNPVLVLRRGRPAATVGKFATVRVRVRKYESEQDAKARASQKLRAEYPGTRFELTPKDERRYARYLKGGSR